ncbi:hypothetical protein STRIP9103_08668 [Streptomyces ipomoeae 91-03]|uniref:Uncharacterized protein n=1 Tax=Streptomyces ipomoeae 91-03 TaxID=698759 RepID=L1KPD8_9ACTN|nr:hypothetical protein STRIP9103_08668 [Streptomyces ipomoeae 91-03]
MLQLVWNLLRDFAYGINAGHAIGHGVRVPARKPPRSPAGRHEGFPR